MATLSKDHLRSTTFLSLDDLLSTSNGVLLARGTTDHFTGVTLDSRSASPGDLFIAIRGETSDGH
ncbi:MAG: UDP-N-acetylmuramoylalanyl-D-glutamyl-2, 6-diaminopimelate--D-alanyl-D-alanine ligase, partial [Candidatus Latescibacteria bacterium]|nr:UDP-N-acetylmuramoylalanyl-D-glutamyl-2, 6-diaminopimelate--D-alanyl-D-alanine ligase [Candidatus Latescibacterota bacterium]